MLLLPLSLPGIASTALLSIILCWNEAFWSLNLTSSQAAPLTTFIASFSAPEGLFWKLRDLRWFAVLPLVAGTAVMVFAKLNGIVIGAAVVGGAAICGGDAWRRRDTVRKLVVAGVTIALMGGIFYVSWYTRGATAAMTMSSSDCC